MSLAFSTMGGGRKLGRFLGIDIRINPSWFVVAALLLIVYVSGASAMGWLAFPLAVLLITLLFGSVLAHEYGHALVARHYGIPTRAITLHGLGGLAQIEGEPRQPGHEIAIAAAGPAVSFALAGLAFLAWIATGALMPAVAPIAGWLAVINFFLGAFNLLPGLPLDGGRILRGVLWARRGDHRSATATAAHCGVRVGQGLMALGVAGLLGIVPFGGLSMILVGFVVYSAASSERLRSRATTFGPLGDVFRAWRAAGTARPRDEDVEVVRFPDGREVLVRNPRR